MTYDPSGVGLPPEPPLDERDEDGYRSNWRRNGGNASLGDIVAADPRRHAFVPGEVLRTGSLLQLCAKCGETRKRHAR
jgi:hypothetical protein